MAEWTRHLTRPVDAQPRLADRSLLTAAEALGTRRVFMIDRTDFETYRLRRGHRHQAIQIVS